jgi:two-component sensor histidine kinase
MRRAALYLFFFMMLYSGTAQEQVRRLQIFDPSFTDSSQVAVKQLADGISAAGKDTACALNLLRSAARIFHVNNLARQEGKCAMAIGDIYFEAGMYGRSFANYLVAQDLFYEVSQYDLMCATLGVAKSQFHRGLYRFAIKALADVTEYGFKNKDERLKASAAEYLGDIFFILQSNRDSKKYFTGAFVANRKMNDDKGSLRIAEKLFTLHYQDRQFDSALWFGSFTAELAEKLGQKNTAQTAQLNKIAALIRLNRLEDAGNALSRFTDKQVTQSDLNTRIRFEAIAGNYYMAQKDMEGARAQYDTAIRHASATNTPDLLAVVYSNMADSYAEQNDYEKAYRYSLKYFDMMNNFYSNSISNLSKIESLIKEDVANSKIKYLSSINRIRELELLRSMDAKQNLQSENTLKDSILKKEKELSIALGLENDYKSQQLQGQQKLSALLNRESQSQKKQLQKEHGLRAALVGGLICLLFLGTLAWYHYVKTKAKNRIIEKQAGELQVLMKEIHHRVKNNLQIISSLLDIQALTLDNGQAAQAIMESKNRVQSMAIIHRFLYHENNIRGISIEDYMKNLSENLFASYNINPDKIKLQTDIEKLSLDVDTMIPLGLIINELVSNSLKYAFVGRETGTLFISLQEKEGRLHLLVKDDGQGFPARMDIQQMQTFGLQLIAAFAQKLKATLELYNDNGAVVYMSIKKYKLA